MIEKLTFKNFGPLKDIQWNNLGKINLVIGGNGSGKTFLLKAIYCSLRTLEEYKRGQEPRSAAEILVDKLYWTFQAGKIGDLVSKGAESSLSSSLLMNGNNFSYSFGRDTTRQILSIENKIPPPRETNSVFFPAKEIASLHAIIMKSRGQDKVFGFDDTYFDLTKALIPLSFFESFYENTEIKKLLLQEVSKLKINLSKSEITKAFELAETTLAEEFRKNKERKEVALKHLNEQRINIRKIINGSIEYDEDANSWFFIKGNSKFPMGVVAEGIKKIGTFDTLLANGYIDSDSIILIDEPEANLHPTAISQLLDIVASLAESGMQFFMASHSYFVVKKLYLIAQERGWSIPVISHDDGEWKMDDLKDGMPDNPIINESIRLYEEEVELAFK
ncbi:MAG: hypothetical protein RIR79_156 [Pseudomonadota bacterium]|jgi:AAA15 family ATPase/GTPase